LSDTVQVVVALLARVDGEHTTEDTCGEALAFSVKVWELPFRLAVRRADVLVDTAATLAVKVPLLCAAPMLTLPGTVMLVLLLESVTLAPEGAAADRVTVQLEVPGPVTVPGEQLRLLGITVPGGGFWGSGIDPAVPDVAIEVPLAVEATTPVT
jgi:hypothetical protein